MVKTIMDIHSVKRQGAFILSFHLTEKLIYAHVKNTGNPPRTKMNRAKEEIIKSILEA